MLKKIIDYFGNTILFYFDKEGNAVFKNYCILKNTGNAYKKELTKPEVGKILEYRFELDKYLHAFYILITIFVYFLFIHLKFTLWNLLWCEFLLLIMASYGRLRASNSYSKFLNKNFGEYELVEFSPNLSPEKRKQNVSNFYSKICLIAIVVFLFFVPAFLLQFGMMVSLKGEKPHTKFANGLSKIYFAFYPKTESIYDMRAFIRYKSEDFKGSLSDYKSVLELSGSNFNKKDFIRFGNLLYLEKNLKNPTAALDLFSDFVTRKKMSVIEESKMLWIKSLFSIENNIADTVIQDYDDMILSLGNDEKNKFYVSSDKAYMLYLMNEYFQAMEIYNELISYAENNEKEFGSELNRLYAERGFAKYKLGDFQGAKQDFASSKIPSDEINAYEPSFRPQKFVTDKF